MTAPAKPPAIPPLFRAALRTADLPMPKAEYRFDGSSAQRKWRFDFAWPERPDSFACLWQVALEVEGGVWVQGRHTRGSGFVKDMEKYNEAAAQGWRILRVTPQRLCHPDTIDLIRRALDA